MYFGSTARTGIDVAGTFSGFVGRSGAGEIWSSRAKRQASSAVEE